MHNQYGDNRADCDINTTVNIIIHWSMSGSDFFFVVFQSQKYCYLHTRVGGGRRKLVGKSIFFFWFSFFFVIKRLFIFLLFFFNGCQSFSGCVIISMHFFFLMSVLSIFVTHIEILGMIPSKLSAVYLLWFENSLLEDWRSTCLFFKMEHRIKSPVSIVKYNMAVLVRCDHASH